MSLMGILLGQRQCRGMVIDAQGRVLAWAQAGYAEAARGTGFSLAGIWPAVRDVIQTMTRHLERAPVTAIGFTSLGSALVGVSPEGAFIDCCLAPDDAPDDVSLEEMLPGMTAAEYYEMTGQMPARLRLLARLCQQTRDDANAYHRTWRYLPPAALMAYHLGGQAAYDPTLAAALAAYDIREERWSGRVLGACRLLKAKLPEIVPSGTVVGQMARDMATDLALTPGVKLVLGGLDMACRALGSGVVLPGLASLDLGSGTEMLLAYNAIALMPLMQQYGIDRWPHVVPDLWQSRLYSARGGAMLRWFRDQLAAVEARQAQRRGINLYDALLEEMPEGLAAPIVVPAAMSTRGDDAWSNGALLGLTLDTTRGDMVKGMLEGIAFEAVHLLERAEAAGLGVEVLRAFGGGARSGRWAQLMADVLGRPVERMVVGRPEPLGAAILAGVATGVYASAEDGVTRAVHISERLMPDRVRATGYREKQTRYLEARRALGLDDGAP